MRTLKKILLAEDDEKDVTLTLAAFKKNNLMNEVIVVNDGQQALDFLYYANEYELREKGNPAVILLDIKMPKVDGLEVLKKIKSDEQLKRIPVVVLTSSREEKDLVKGYEYGANSYVVKPVDFNEFTDAVSKLGLYWAVINEVPPGN